MDLFHCQVAEGDLSAKMRKYIENPAETRVGHIQFAGVPGRHEPDAGELNYDFLFNLIDELGFKGWVGCEYIPRGGTSEGLDWFRKRQAASK
jgi:hydroxypyruvate isomerase